MTTADVSLVAKESIVVEKLKNYMPAQFFSPMLYVYKAAISLGLLIHEITNPIYSFQQIVGGVCK